MDASGALLAKVSPSQPFERAAWPDPRPAGRPIPSVAAGSSVTAEAPRPRVALAGSPSGLDDAAKAAPEAASGGVRTAGRSEARQDGGAGLHGTNALPDILAFRDYTLVPKSRQLRRNRRDVEIGGRAFDLLTLLVSSRGQVVTKEQILAYVWPSMTVEESNLRFQMAALRKVLGNDRDMIKTVAGRGYIFVANDELGALDDDMESSAHHVPALNPPDRHRQSDLSVVPGFENAPDVVLIGDESVREALGGLLDFMGLTVEAHRSVQAFLETQPRAMRKCLILDV